MRKIDISTLLQNKYINEIAIILFSLLLIGVVWSGALHGAKIERETKIEDAISETAGLAHAFEEHTISTIKRVDQLLLLIKSQYEKNQQATDIFQLIKTAGLDLQPLVLLSIADQKGNLIMSNQEPFLFSNIYDREHFQIHQTSNSQGLFISNPVLGRSSGKISIQLTRRINHPDGSFAGVIVASLSPLYFTDFYQQVDLGRDAVMALIKPSGMIEAWGVGISPLIGKNLQELDSNLMKHLSTNEIGSYNADTTIDGIKRIYNYRTLNEYPLIVLVGKSKANVLKNFDEVQNKHMTNALLMTFSIFIVCTILILVSLSRKRAAKLQLALYKISATASSSKNLEELYLSVHQIVSELIRANNFYIALYDQPNGMLFFPYRADNNGDIPECREFSNGVTEYVIQKGEALCVDPQAMFTLKALGEIAEQEIWFAHWLGVPLRKSDGTIFGAMAVFTTSSKPYTNRDKGMLTFVSDQIAMAIERKYMENALGKSQERYRLTMEGTTEGLWDYNIIKDEMYYSKRFAELIGIAPGQTLTMEEFSKKLVPPEDIPRMYAAAREMLEGKTLDYLFEYGIMRGEDLRWILIRGKAIHDENGQPVRAVGAAIDITKRKELELELQTKNTQLDALNGEIQRDLHWAAQVQYESLPKPFHGDKVSVNSIYLPYHIVSGDFINYQWSEKHKQLRGYVIDVSGHGMAPALQTATLKMLLDSKLLGDKEIVEEDIQAINQSMMRYLYEESFAGLLYFEFDFQSATLKVISAGIQIFLISTSNRCELLSLSSGYLGVFDNTDNQTITLPLKSGEVYCMMTDGVSDLLEAHGISKQNGLAGHLSWLETLAQSPERTDDFSAVCIEIL